MLGWLHTALHHLRQRLHRCLLRTLESRLGQEGADHHLQGPSPGQVVVLCRTGSCFTAAPTLKIQLITYDVDKQEKLAHDRADDGMVEGTLFKALHQGWTHLCKQ